jgi:hypothetical protein
MMLCLVWFLAGFALGAACLFLLLMHEHEERVRLSYDGENSGPSCMICGRGESTD